MCEIIAGLVLLLLVGRISSGIEPQGMSGTCTLIQWDQQDSWA